MGATCPRDATQDAGATCRKLPSGAARPAAETSLGGGLSPADDGFLASPVTPQQPAALHATSSCAARPGTSEPSGLPHAGFSQRSIFAGRVVPNRRKARWGNITLVDAERLLLAEALKDPLNERQGRQCSRAECFLEKPFLQQTGQHS